MKKTKQNKTKQANENKDKGKEERNKIHCKGNKRGCSKMNIFQRLPWMNENKIQTQDTKRKIY